jgi:carboxyl-terminal processing protease
MNQFFSSTLAGLIAASSAILVSPQPALAEEPSASRAARYSPDFAKRIDQITSAILDNHVDPPPRQQLILSGFKALYKAAGVPVPAGLSRRISSVVTSEQLEAFVADAWPKPTPRSAAPAKLETAFIDGLLASVPGGARLLSAKERKVDEQFKGNRYVGIHIALGMDDQEKRPKIAEVFEGGPADRAGAKSGDLIEKINDLDTKSMALRDAVDHLRGEEGTDVTIKVRQPKESKSRTMKITRGQLPHATISGAHKRPDGSWDVRLDGAAPIAYLCISEIAGSTPHELRKLARQLESQGNCGLVLDLRNLGGTSLHEAVMLADCLLAGGTIGRVQTAQREVTYQADSDALFRSSPIAVLIDQTTSGTAEWLAAALQDNHRAILVGAPTWNSLYAIRAGAELWASVRSMVTIGDGSWSLELATGRLERGDGRPISDESRIIEASEWFTRRRQPEEGKVSSGVKPDRAVGANGNDSARRMPPRDRRKPTQEPNPANDEALREAVQLLQQSLQKFI